MKTEQATPIPDKKTDQILNAIQDMSMQLKKNQDKLTDEDRWSLGAVYTQLWTIMYNRGLIK